MVDLCNKCGEMIGHYRKKIVEERDGEILEFHHGCALEEDFD